MKKVKNQKIPREPAESSIYDDYDLYNIYEYELKLIRYFVRSINKNTIYSYDELKYIAENSILYHGTIKENLTEFFEMKVNELEQFIKAKTAFTPKNSGNRYQTDIQKREEEMFLNLLEYLDVNKYIESHKHEYYEFLFWGNHYTVEFVFPENKE